MTLKRLDRQMRSNKDAFTVESILRSASAMSRRDVHRVEGRIGTLRDKLTQASDAMHHHADLLTQRLLCLGPTNVGHQHVDITERHLQRFSLQKQAHIRDFDVEEFQRRAFTAA